MSEQKEKNMPEEKLPEAKLPESAPVSEGEALTALADAILATDEPEEIADVPEDDELEPTHGARGKKEKPEDTQKSREERLSNLIEKGKKAGKLTAKELECLEEMNLDGEAVDKFYETLEKNGAEADCLRPCFSVLDPALTESLPAYQTACGITDIMAHTFERYFTNTPDVEVTDRMLEGVLLAMLHEGRRVMEDPHNYEARANIMWAGMVCHNDIMGVGRQQDWNSHHLEHVLSAKYDCAHGAGLAVIMPAWMRYCAEHGSEKRLAQMAVRVFGCQMDFDDPKRTALEGIEAFRAFLRSIGMPLTFAEIGADPADIPELVKMNHIGDGKTGGYIGLDRQAHFDIYNLAAGSCVPEK